MEWISVEDELPEDGDDLIVFINNGGIPHVAMGRYNEWGFHYPSHSINSGSMLFDVTHWHPLPPPPTKKPD